MPAFSSKGKCNGVIGVPITYLAEHCVEQFKILGQTSGRKEYHWLSYPSKIFTNCKQHNPDGTITNGSKINTGAEIVIEELPKTQAYYTADNASGPMRRLYNRILIQRKPIGKIS